MDRCALFVDAGYALADGAMAVHGTRRRDSVSWDHAGLLKLLAGLARDRTGLPVLRCYWYETAAEARRTAEHDALAEMPGLKLRLVNALPGRREGIESQLRRDLVTLAKSGAISDAFIASANEHIAEIVAEVQDLGLRVVILHIASDSGWTIPLPLRQECDDIVEISGVHLRSYVDLIRGAEPAALPAPPAAVYQVHDANEHRQDSLSYASAGSPALGEPRITPGMAEPRISADYQAEHAASGSTQQSAPPKSTVSGAQSAASAVSSGVPPYSAAPSYSGSIGRQADSGSGYQHTGAYQNDSGVDYQDGVVTNYQNGSAASYQGAGGGHGQAGHGPGLDRASQTGPAQAGPAQNGADQAPAGQSGDAHSRGGRGGVASPGEAAQSAFPGDSGLSSLAAVGYQQQNSYQRGPGQGGIDRRGSGQSGTAGQNGAGYQSAGQNGAAQFGYASGQQGGPVPGSSSSYQPGGPGQHSMPGQGGSGGPGQTQAGQQGQASQPAPPVQSQNGQSQVGYPLGHAGQNGVRPGAMPSGFAPGGAQLDPRSRDPYGSGLPQGSGGPDVQPTGGQFSFGAPEAGFVSGQVQGPHPGQDGGVVVQPQYQVPQPPTSLPAVRVQQPVAIALPDAVKAAHAEGFNFGESVGRDAPGLWLEAVLARKPRMPSDLEARLLQGSALPIDSLLHDEVRHSLRRGFWDALESARR